MVVRPTDCFRGTVCHNLTNYIFVYKYVHCVNMPKKGKKSQSAKQQWQKQKQAETLPPDSNKDVDLPDVSSANWEVRQGGQTDGVCVPGLSYADIVKKGCHSAPNVLEPCYRDNVIEFSHNDCVPGLSFVDAVKRGCHSGPDVLKPPNRHREIESSHIDLANDVKCILASHSQNDTRYSDISRNKQCACNSLTFLAFLHENEHITSENLDLVLEKGNSMYFQILRMLKKKERPVYNHLATDELPESVFARTHKYRLTKHLSSYGSLGEPPAEAVDEYLDLRTRLSCFLTELTEASYALLVMTGLVTAIFRDKSGKYGLFDPHSRTPDALPHTEGSHGTAVMLTFTHLCDLINRIIACHQMFDTPSRCEYELMPVEFLSKKKKQQNSTCTDSTS